MLAADLMERKSQQGTKTVRIAITGAGAVGSVLCSLLWRAGDRPRSST